MSVRIRNLVLLAAVMTFCGIWSAWAQSPAASEAPRLAVVDMDRVMSESEMGRVEQSAIDRLRAERTAIISAKQNELEELEANIRNASLAWSDERREARVREYEGRRIELRRLNEDATRDVQNEFNKSLARLQRAALGVTAEIGRESGYTLILEKKTLPVLFASDAIDVTSEVLRRLNAKASEAPAGTPGTPGAPGGQR